MNIVTAEISRRNWEEFFERVEKLREERLREAARAARSKPRAEAPDPAQIALL